MFLEYFFHTSVLLSIYLSLGNVWYFNEIFFSVLDLHDRKLFYIPVFALVCNVWTNVLSMKHTSDDIVSSAECSSDDEDLEECETNNPGGLG